MKNFKILLFLITVSLVTKSNGQSISVFVTNTGDKYHKRSCHHLKYSKKEIKCEKALELGFVACSVCKPASPKINENSVSTTNSLHIKVTKATASVQCAGKTKAGLRCKRKTTNANRRCYQHQ